MLASQLAFQASRKPSKAFPEPPKSLLAPSWGQPGVQEPLRSDFGTILERFWEPRTLKNLQKQMKTNDFQCFRDIAIQPSKETKKAPKGAPREPKMTPRSAPGRPGSDPRRHHELPGTPQERPRSAPRETKSRPRGPGDPKSAPRAPQERPRSHFGAFFEPPGPDFHQFSNTLVPILGSFWYLQHSSSVPFLLSLFWVRPS